MLAFVPPLPLFDESSNKETADTVEGIVERVTYESDQTGFRVVRVQTDKGIVSVIGKMQRLSPGAKVRAQGAYEQDPRFGRQLRAQTILILEPDTIEGLTRYLGSGLVKGIGPALAKRIIEVFGESTLHVLDASPDRIAEVPGLGSKRAEALARAWEDQRAARDVMVFLQGHGISASLAVKVFRRYGRDSIRIVSQDPYRLAQDVWGIGFHRADEIAKSIGISDTDPVRLRAAVVHALDEIQSRGHVYAPRAELELEASKFIGVEPELMRGAVDDACRQNLVCEDRIRGGIPVLYRERRYYEECALAEMLATRAHAIGSQLAHVDLAIEAFEQHCGTVLADAQRDAVRKAAKAQLLVITGGPGVGKTTVVRAILDLFRRSKLHISLAAPTGRAARRMAEATGHPAHTIHRLLEFDPRSGTFLRTDKNKLDLDALIVDESSMLDLPLAHALIRAVPTRARIVLVGDVDQLPSIGPGAILRDIIESKQVETIRLTQIFRQSARSKIVENAHRILEGLAPEPPEKDDKSSDFFVVSVKSPEQAAAMVRRLVQERIPESFGFEPRRQVQVLTPIHRGSAGTEALNEMLQTALNPNGKSFICSGKKFRVGDKVMQMRNNYELEAFNGDIGIIEAFDNDARTMHVELEGRKLVYEEEHADDLSLAYACSIHKSQGSEYPAAIVVMLSSHYVMLARNLLYTAVTRGKKLVVLVTDQNALRVSLDADRQEDRATYLSERMQAWIEQQPREHDGP